MNSGCYENDISFYLQSLNWYGRLSREGNKKRGNRFFYRGNNLSNNLIIIFKIKRQSSIKRINRAKTNWNDQRKKLSNQVVKTVEALLKILVKMCKAWMLIKQTDVIFFKREMPQFQKNIVIFCEQRKAKSSDIEKLINKVRQTVVEKTGVNLELEIKIIGEWKEI